MPWISTRALTELRNRVETYAENARGAREVQRAALGNAARIAEKFVDLDGSVNGLEKRLDRALRACVGYRATIRKRDNRIAALEARLDDLLGLNQPAIRDGVLWQERRTDKPKQVAP